MNRPERWKTLIHEACGKLTDTWFNSKRSGIKNSQKTDENMAVVSEKNTAWLYIMSDKESCYPLTTGKGTYAPNLMSFVVYNAAMIKRSVTPVVVAQTRRPPTPIKTTSTPNKTTYTLPTDRQLRSSTAQLDTPTEICAEDKMPLIVIPDDASEPGRLNSFTSAVQKLRQMKAKQATASAKIQQCGRSHGQKTNGPSSPRASL